MAGACSDGSAPTSRSSSALGRLCPISGDRVDLCPESSGSHQRAETTSYADDTRRLPPTASSGRALPRSRLGKGAGRFDTPNGRSEGTRIYRSEESSEPNRTYLVGAEREGEARSRVQAGCHVRTRRICHVRALPWLPQTSQATLFRHADPKRGRGGSSSFSFLCVGCLEPAGTALPGCSWSAKPRSRRARSGRGF
jgi:hypothetical protein